MSFAGTPRSSASSWTVEPCGTFTVSKLRDVLVVGDAPPRCAAPWRAPRPASGDAPCGACDGPVDSRDASSTATTGLLPAPRLAVVGLGLAGHAAVAILALVARDGPSLPRDGRDRPRVARGRAGAGAAGDGRGAAVGAAGAARARGRDPGPRPSSWADSSACCFRICSCCAIWSSSDEKDGTLLGALSRTAVLLGLLLGLALGLGAGPPSRALRSASAAARRRLLLGAFALAALLGGDALGLGLLGGDAGPPSALALLLGALLRLDLGGVGPRGWA